MGMPWFRFHAEFVSDPKVQMMSETLQRRFVMLMCMRCSNDDATLHATEIAFVLRISDEELEETKAVFLAKGFIDEDWNLLNWDKRQYASDSSTERSKLFRERQKEDVQRAATQCNVAATPPDTEQIQNKTDKIKTLPSDKRSAASKPERDARHVACRDHVHGYWHHHHPEDKLAPWDPSEAKALDRLLKSKPDLTPERFRQLLGMRSRSDANQSERPRVWLERLLDYAGGPLDRFKLPAQSGPQPGAVIGMYQGEQSNHADPPNRGTPPPSPDIRANARAQHLRKVSTRRALVDEEQNFLASHDAQIAAVKQWSNQGVGL
jgi:hypothetical protein